MTRNAGNAFIHSGEKHCFNKRSQALIKITKSSPQKNTANLKILFYL